MNLPNPFTSLKTRKPEEKRIVAATFALVALVAISIPLTSNLTQSAQSIDSSALEPPKTPVLVSAESACLNNGSNTIMLKWKKTEGADWYTFETSPHQINYGSKFGFQRDTNENEQSFEVQGSIQDKTTYHIRMYALGAYPEYTRSNASNTIKVTTKDCSPEAVNDRVSATTITSVEQSCEDNTLVATMKWEHVKDYRNYKVFHNKDSVFNTDTMLAETQEAQLTDKTLEKNTNYYSYVIAYYQNGPVWEPVLSEVYEWKTKSCPMEPSPTAEVKPTAKSTPKPSAVKKTIAKEPAKKAVTPISPSPSPSPTPSESPTPTPSPVPSPTVEVTKPPSLVGGIVIQNGLGILVGFAGLAFFLLLYIGYNLSKINKAEHTLTPFEPFPPKNT